MKVSSRTIWAVMVMAGAACLATMFMPKARIRRVVERPDLDADRRVDEASEDSFPASDPPSFSAPAGGAQADRIPPASNV